MNSSLHINAIVSNQENAIHLINEHTLCVSRWVIVRKKSDNSYEIMLAENSDSKWKWKAGKFEFLWWKVYDNLQDQKKFLELSTKDKMRAITQWAIAEIWEEGWIFIPEHQIHFLEVQSRDISDDIYTKNGMRISNIQTHFYMAILWEWEFDDVNRECIEQISNDDDHKDVRWESISDITDIEFILALLWPNSQININKTNKKLQEIIEINQFKIHEILTQSWSQLTKKSVSPVDLSWKKEYIDSYGQLDKVQNFREYYHSQFWIPLNTHEVNNNVKHILSNYVVPHIREIIDKLWIYNEWGLDLLEKFSQDIPNISSTEDLFYFFQSNRQTRIGHAIIQRFFAYRHIKNLPYFDYIDGNLKDFQDQLVSLCDKKDEKFIINNFSWKKVELKLDSNSKALNRMASKITTKPYINSNNIKDVYRARFIVEEENDVAGIKTFLLKKLWWIQSRKTSAWNLVKKEQNTNLNADSDRKEIKLLWKFPIYEDGEYINGVSIPVEIQIMTRASYEKHESWAKHHSVYEPLQALVDVSRWNHGVKEVRYLNIIQKLSDDKDIQSSYPDAHKWRHTQQRLYDDILKRFNQYFYKTRDDKYMPYQHTYRYMHSSGLVHKQNEYFMDMCKSLNDIFSLNLTSLEWYHLLNEEEKSSNILENIMHKNSRNFTVFFSKIKNIKLWISNDRISYLKKL